MRRTSGFGLRLLRGAIDIFVRLWLGCGWLKILNPYRGHIALIIGKSRWLVLHITDHLFPCSSILLSFYRDRVVLL